MLSLKTRNRNAFFFPILISLNFLLCLVLLGCGQKVRNLACAGKNIICLGNSITAGAGAGEAEDFPSLLRKNLSMPVINAGVAGDTTSGGLKRIKPDVLDKEPFLVIVELGGNDFLNKAPLKGTLKNIDEIVKKIEEQGAIVVLLDVKANFFMNGYSRGYRKIARKRGAVFVPDILAEILSHLALKSDYVHPNASGYKILSQKLLEVILPLLQRNRELRRN